MSIACKIPYIEADDSLSEQDKIDYTNKHIEVLKEVLSEPNIKFNEKSRSSLVDGKKIKYLVIDDKNKDAYDFLKQGEYSNYIGLKPIQVGDKTKNVLIINVFGESSILDGDIEPEVILKQHREDLLNYSDKDTDIHKDLISITEDEETRKELYTIFESIKDKSEKLIQKVDTRSGLWKQLKELLNGFKDPNFLYRSETAVNFLRWSVDYTRRSLKLFTGKDSFQKQLEKLEELETFQERKVERGLISKKIDNIKNKYYIYSKLDQVVQGLGLNAENLNVFDTYNRFTIEKAVRLKVLKDLDEDKKDEAINKIELIFANNYKDKFKLVTAINEQFTIDAKFLNDSINNATFENLKTTNPNEPKKTLTQEILDTRDGLNNLIKKTKNMMVDLQVDLLWDSYRKYVIGADNQTEYDNIVSQYTTFDRSKLLTKDQIRQSIEKVDGNVSWLGYNLARAEDQSDTFNSLLGILLKRTNQESNQEAFYALQNLDEQFRDLKEVSKKYNKDILTYTFDLTNPGQPVELTTNEEGKLVYTYFQKEDGILVEKTGGNYDLPTEGLYNRYFKLSKTSDDLWAYKADNGKYYKVYATKAIKGLTNQHRIAIENSILFHDLPDLVEKFLKGADESLIVTFKDVETTILKTDNGLIKQDWEIRNEIKKAFNLQYRDLKDAKESIDIINDVAKQLETSTKEETKKILQENFYPIYFDSVKEREIFKQQSNKKRNKYIYASSIDPDSKEDTRVFLATLKDNDNPTWLRLTNINGVDTFVKDKISGFDIIEFDDIKHLYRQGKTFSKFKDSDSKLTDPEFENLQNNPEFVNYYERVVNAYKQLQGNDHFGFLTHGKLGQITSKNNSSYEKLFENVKEDGLASTLKNKFDDYFRINETGEDSKSLDGFTEDDFSPKYTKRINNQSKVEDDVILNIMEMTNQNVNYNSLYSFESNMKFALLQNEGSTELGIDERILDKSKKYKFYKDNYLKLAHNSLKYTINAFFYGEPKVKDALLAGTTLEKVIDKTRNLLFFQTLAINLGSSFRNLVVGQTNNFLEASSKKYGLDSKTVLESSGELLKHSGDLFKGIVGHGNISDSHYLVKFSYLTESIAGLGLDAKNFKEDKSKLDTYLSLNAAYMGQQMTEAMNILPLMVGYAKKYAVEVNEDGSVYSMYDAIRVDGKKLSENPDSNGKLTLVDQDGFILKPDVFSKFTFNLQTLLSEAQGDYGKYNNTYAKNTVLGKMALTFANWLYPNMKKRFDPEITYDKSNKTTDYGGYQTVYLMNTLGRLSDWKDIAGFGPEQSVSDFIREKGFSNILLDKSIPLAKELGKNVGKTIINFPLSVLTAFSDYRGIENKNLKSLLNIKDGQEFEKFFKLKKLEGETDQEWQERRDDAYEKYITSLQTASKEYAILTALIIIGIGLKALDDEEEDPTVTQKILKSLDVQSRQIVSDMGLGAPLLAPFKSLDFFSQRAKDPFMIMRTAQLNLKLIGQLIGFQFNLEQGSVNFTINDKYEKSGPGYSKGEYKINRTLERTLFAPFYQISKILEPEQQEKITKMLNKGSIITDSDLEKPSLTGEDEEND